MGNNKNKDYDLLHFEDAFPDGRLVDDARDVNKNFRFREALELSKELGRPLTKEEMDRYEKSLVETGEPFDTTKLPKFKINFPEISRYAKSIGKSVSELTEDEIDPFIEDGYQKLVEYIKETKDGDQIMSDSMKDFTDFFEELGRKEAIKTIVSNMIKELKKENPNTTNMEIVTFVKKYLDLSEEEIMEIICQK